MVDIAVGWRCSCVKLIAPVPRHPSSFPPGCTTEQDYQESWGRFMRMMQHNARRYKSSATWRRGMGFE